MKMAKKIVVVDDEKQIADILEFNLEKEGYEVHCAYDGNDGLDLIMETVPDLVLLDMMLPGMDGMEICREVRKKHDMPIIMLTAKDSEIDKVLGLELSADDYVTKPFSTRELIARVKANLRRNQETAPKEKEVETNNIQLNDIMILPDSYSIKNHVRYFVLNNSEFDIILF